MTIVTVFRSRLRDGVEDEYEPLADAMSRIVSSMAGFVDQKFYVAPDGERVTIVRFADEASHRAWARHPDHLSAQRRGREEFYSWFDISVAEESRGRTFSLE
jgi:heme-degrading monooxygenase HmoA